MFINFDISPMSVGNNILCHSMNALKYQCKTAIKKFNNPSPQIEGGCKDPLLINSCLMIF